MAVLFVKPSWIFLSTLLLFCLISLSHQRATKKDYDHNNGGITGDLIHSCMIGSSSSPDSEPSAPITATTNSGEYMIKIRIGTPPIEVLGIFDISNELTWTQCSPCNSTKDGGVCEKQQLPIFDPTKSRTYRNVSCGSDRCSFLEVGIGCGDAKDNTDPCKYVDAYGGRNAFASTSQGQVALETFTFNDDSSFPEVVFGCGYKNIGMAGVIGLGRGNSSIVRQLEKSIGGAKFSYCLPSNVKYVSGKITLGGKAIVTGPKVVSTPIKKGLYGATYYITFDGVSVGNKTLSEYYNNDDDDDDDSFANKVLKRNGNMVMETRETQTRLSRSLYDRLVTELVSAINTSSSNNKRVPDPRRYEDDRLCYAGNVIGSPPVTIHLDGADLVLPQESTFVEVEKDVFCLSFSPTLTKLTYPVLGSIHQRNHLIGFDLDNRVINFLPTDCSKPVPMN